ncbi:hypothetical protein RD792_018142 [Penstemon davidsonii]|uniref:Uncharacterized protein n=1 Tax=Penstemon davidsonii TaxID=160366 RepID=A0ABR0DVV3_9LAMI|nr:hypothetical protein RD792_018142 [Penstemon davidsonii]
MAKAIALVSAVCILALATLAQSHSNNVFSVTGKVYCDPCRVQFQHQFSRNLPGTVVKLLCSNIHTKNVTYSVVGVTDKTGYYDLRVEGDHHNEICEVSVLKSPKPECSEKMSKVESSKIECTGNGGEHSNILYANPIGLMTKDVLPKCSEVENFDKV